MPVCFAERQTNEMLTVTRITNTCFSEAPNYFKVTWQHFSQWNVFTRLGHLRNQVFRDTTLHCGLFGSWHFERRQCLHVLGFTRLRKMHTWVLEDKHTTFLQNISKHLGCNTVTRPRQSEPSTPQCKSQISHGSIVSLHIHSLIIKLTNYHNYR